MFISFRTDTTYRSPSMIAINGWTDEEINRNYFKMTHPEDLEMIKKVHEEVLMNPGKSVNITYRILHKNGHYIWIESMLCNNLSDPDFGAVVTVTHDVTDRKRMEAGLMEAEIKFRTLAEKSMVGIYISQKERFTYVNPRFAEIFGYEPKEMINTSESAIDMIISKDDQSIVRKNILARYKGEVDNAHYEVTGKKKDGTYNFIEFYGSRVIINGETLIIGTMLDITERKKAEENLKAAYSLIQDHIGSIKDMAWKQSHLIRSHVANLKALATALNEDPADSKILQFINLELDRLDAVIIGMAEYVPSHNL